MVAIQTLLASFLLYSIPTCLALSPISTTGAKFYDESGNQFFIKGVIYSSPSNNDADTLTTAAQCKLDATLMQKLGVNTIRLYSVDVTKDHSGCMSAFESAGIYVLVGLETEVTRISTSKPAWTVSQQSGFQAVIDAFASYDNTLGFFVGNEIITELSQSNVALYLKAAAADMKAYRDAKGYRKIPIGYSSADSAELAPYLQDYLACGRNSIDFFGQINYAWCGASSFILSGYDKLTKSAAGLSIPIFFSETGCNTQTRVFTDQDAILGRNMDGQWSGSIIYAWAEGTNDYGLVSYPSGATTGTPTPISKNGFNALSTKWASLSPTGTPLSAAASVTALPCPSFTSSGWLISSDPSLPTLNSGSASGSASSTASSGSASATGTSAASSKSTTASAKTSTASNKVVTSTVTGTEANHSMQVVTQTITPSAQATGDGSAATTLSSSASSSSASAATTSKTNGAAGVVSVGKMGVAVGAVLVAFIV